MQNLPPQQPQQFIPPQLQQQLQYESLRASATMSYTNKAMFTLLLYIFLWFPGFIANIIYLLEANKTKKLTGIAPSGYGCLVTLLVVAIAPLLIGLVVWIGVALTSISH